jgi:phospholipid/cholesterol/gamma-HCH transport system substrate-binding protein
MSDRMSEPGGTLDQIEQGTNALLSTGQTLNATLVPRLNRTVDDAARTVRHIGRAVESVNDNPQALLLGNGVAVPGPGEPGFVAPGHR